MYISQKKVYGLLTIAANVHSAQLEKRPLQWFYESVST